MSEAIEVELALAKRLVAEQHPDLLADLVFVASGWDNSIFRLGDSLTVRLPRRAEAAQLALNDERWLPLIASGVTTPIPVPVRVGRPTDYVPWPWSIGRSLDGEPAIKVTPAVRRSIAEELADFYVELHQPAPADAPVNDVRGVPLRDRAKAVSDRLTGGRVPRAPQLLELWDRLLVTPARVRSPVWLH